MASAKEKAGGGIASAIVTTAISVFLGGSRYPHLALTLYIVAALSALYAMLQWGWVQKLLGFEPISDTLPVIGTGAKNNQIHRDNLGRLVAAESIGVYNEAPQSIVAAPLEPNSPILQMANSLEMPLVQEKGLKWRRQHDGHPMLVSSIMNRNEIDGHKAAHAESIVISLQFNDYQGPVRYIPRAYWIGHSENVVDIKIGTIKDFLIGYAVDSYWITFHNERETPTEPTGDELEMVNVNIPRLPGPYSSFRRVTNVIVPRRIPRTEGLSVTATVFSEKTGQNFDKRTFYL